MKAFPSLSTLAVALTVGVLGATPVAAVPFAGTATITGFHSIDGTNLTNNTSFDFTGSPSISPIATGDLAAFVAGATATLNVDPWSFTPYADQIPFLTLTNGADSVVFDLDTSLTILSRTGDDISSSLSLYLLGTLTATGPGFVGLDPSAASLSFAATAAGTTGGYTISLASPPAPIVTETPEPASIALLGAGLAAVGALRRRKKS